jgi:lipopolysaccharide transport system ATP-binding protein
MGNTAIKVENLSKIYRLGEIGTGSIGQDVDRWFKTKILGKEDPFLKIGETNDRANKGASNIVYSLSDINFEIQQGDAVGIIGRNGAGKSTLLKILSRVTTPTTGRINIKGRVASLLEVGTGFHPELTGRENIYLNGAILGMRKREIDRKLDEIIDFSGVERYIDTPVKRYSSGMYVRLAFAVAAHLESEILIVDEVLAVGDAEFQKKCLGKMGEVSKGEGRTVLFVSHNMAAVRNLCQCGLVLSEGKLSYNEDINNSIENYQSLIHNNNRSFTGAFSQTIHLKSIEVFDNDNKVIDYFYSGEDLYLNLKLETIQENCNFSLAIQFENNEDQVILYSYNQNLLYNIKLGKEYNYKIHLRNVSLVPGNYKINIWIGLPGAETYLFPKNIFTLKVLQGPKIKLSDQWNKELGLYYIEPEIKLI